MQTAFDEEKMGEQSYQKMQSLEHISRFSKTLRFYWQQNYEEKCETNAKYTTFQNESNILLWRNEIAY